MTYPEAIDWLYATQQFGIKLGLDQPRRLLRELCAYPSPNTQVIHVAGTNGKGSTCAIIDALARACGRRTGLFTSPHLISYTERIQVNGQEIPEETTARYLTEIKELVANWENHPTFFELSLAVAMRHFRDQECELIILETGMGGRLDATTAVPADIAVITPIAHDHSQWLGDTLGAIAAEKAGIIQANKPVISSPQEPEAQSAIEQEANALRATLEWVTEPLYGYHLNIPGPHQQSNAAIACATVEKIGLPITSDVVRHALATVAWPGRFERIPNTPYILDATHNPHAAHALVETWQQEYPDHKASIIFGAVEGKNTEAVLNILTPITEHFHFVPTNSPRALTTGELRDALPENAPPHTCHPDLKSLIQHTKFNTPDSRPKMVLITGSLFLIGEAKAILSGKKTRTNSQ
jgi:dihydrofolate synthase/folylpolyglutamate synthase